jgi:cytochrome P450
VETGDINLTGIPEYPSPALIECPYPFYARLREESPVHRLANGDVMVTRWTEIEQILGDRETFSNLIGPDNPQVLGGGRVGGDDSGPWPLPFADDPAHVRQRKLCRSIAARKWLAWFEPVVTRLADELIDTFVARGEAEFRSEFAEVLPRRVVMEAFGFPRADEEQLVEWSRGPGPVGSRLASDDDRAHEARRRLELAAYMEQAIAARHARGGDDYLTELVAEQVARDGRLDMPYLLAEVTNLFSAGNVTTAHMMTSAMRLLLDRAADLDRVYRDRALIGPMLEESMRVESPVQWLQRLTTRDCSLAGVEIASGTMLLIVWASANRDPARFEDPERFDLDRPGVVKKQLAFGYGPHRCVGAPLARLEGRVAFDRVLTRLPGLRSHPRYPEATHISAPNQRAPTAVHIAFDPG